jgi:hypothetical protein
VYLYKDIILFEPLLQFIVISVVAFIPKKGMPVAVSMYAKSLDVESVPESL